MALTDNLISYWELEETSGSRADAHTGGNTLSDNNTVTSNPGKVATAAQFTVANSEYLSRADNASLSMGDIDFTIAAWVYFDTVANQREIVGKGFSPHEYRLLYAGPGTGLNHFAFAVSNDGSSGFAGEIDATTFGAASASTWYFVVAWHDSVANTVNIQINNGTVDSVSYSLGVFDGTADFNIGGYGGFETWDGRIDQVGLWKRVLSSTERTSLWNGGSGMSYAALSGGGAADLSVVAQEPWVGGSTF